MESFKKSIIFLGVFTLALLLLAESRPITSKGNNKRQSPDNFGFPETVDVVTERPDNSCYVHVTRQHIEERPVENPDGSSSTIEEVVNITTRECCSGYTGVECNQIVDPYQQNNPCRGLTCTNHPDAICAVITRCGRDIPLFIDQSGRKVDCNDDSGSGSVPDIDSLSCGGVCTSNPCQGQTCQANPSAMCLIRSCDCSPMWFVETGEQIDCSTGEPIPPRRRRQTSDGSSTTCRK